MRFRFGGCCAPGHVRTGWDTVPCQAFRDGEDPATGDELDEDAPDYRGRLGIKVQLVHPLAVSGLSRVGVRSRVHDHVPVRRTPAEEPVQFERGDISRERPSVHCPVRRSRGDRNAEVPPVPGPRPLRVFLCPVGRKSPSRSQLLGVLASLPPCVATRQVEPQGLALARALRSRDSCPWRPGGFVELDSCQEAFIHVPTGA
jgi:hypothetical protein